MQPTVVRSNRSSLQSSIQPTTPSTLLHQHPSQQHHHQQQQIVYGPIANPMVTLQPCGTGVHPSCIYPGAQRNAVLSNPLPLHMQGKNSRWPSKSKVLRGQQQYCQHQQQQLSYNPKPLVIYDQNQANGPPAPSTTSFLVASSTFTHGSFPADQYNNSGVALIPQTYFKAPDVQAFCLLQDRTNAQQQQHQQQQQEQSHGSFYNISATNTCSLQAVNANATFQFPALPPYAAVTTFTNNQIAGPLQTVQTPQTFPSPPVNLVFGGHQREKQSSLSTLDISSYKCAKIKPPTASASQLSPIVRTDGYAEWPCQAVTSSTDNGFEVSETRNEDRSRETTEIPPEKTASISSTKAQEDHYSDESSTSFDFTIEAEKMVSALCNTTSSNDLAKEEVRNNKTDSAPLFSGAGDTVSNKNTWFNDFCANYETGRSIGIQTEGFCTDRSQYPELIRKAVYWGCTEAEILLSGSGSKTDSKGDWLKDLSTATKTAITKSSTCFPIFAGDRAFIGDLINALLRISNGWLILDNYLNKQHYPSLEEKLDRELLRCFEMWEESTYELVNQIVRAFLRLEETGEASNLDENPAESPGTSFPGDVSLYTSHDLFEPSSGTSAARQQDSSNRNNSREAGFAGARFASPQLTGVRNFRPAEVGQQRHQRQKESRLRSKWTVTENLTIDSTKSVPDMFLGHAEAAVHGNGRFQSRCSSSSSARLDASTQSLNAEFFHLRSKVLEGNQETTRWNLKNKKQEVESKMISSAGVAEPNLRIQRSTAEGSNDTYPQKVPFDPSINTESAYFAVNTDTAGTLESNYAVCPSYTMADYNVKTMKSLEQNYPSKPTNFDPVYVGKSSMNQLELAAVPRNKMTLLSQIEPCVPEKASEGMTANLSAWFASMRNSDGHRQMPISSLVETRPVETVQRLLPRPETLKSAMDLTRQLQIDADRQLQTLQNMQSIQSAPWKACNLISNRVHVHHVPEEYDSSEDVRVYMKPGSYNVPKKRHQRRSNRRMENSSMSRGFGGSNSHHRSHCAKKEKAVCTPASSTPVSRAVPSGSASTTIKLPFPATPIVPPPTFSLQSSPRILKRAEQTNRGISEDVTWKAACASAEILLQALNVKEETETVDAKDDDRCKVDEDNADGKDGGPKVEQGQEKSQESLSKASKHDCDGASSYEASEDDSGSTYRLSPNASLVEVSQSSENRNGFNKTNVKTDSWLIRTLNNASIVKQKRRKTAADHRSSESSNSSIIGEERAVRVSSLTTIDAATTIATTTTIEKFQQATCARDVPYASTSRKIHVEETEHVVGKATYSETVRRCTPLSSIHSGKKDSSKKSKSNATTSSSICGTVIPIPGRRCQRKDPERAYHLLHKSRKSFGKKCTRNCEVNEPQLEEGASSKSKASKNDVKENSSVVSIVTSSAAPAKNYGKRKDGVSGYAESLDGKLSGKSNDRGWSVWYSSKRKQSLSPLALSKLETIHQTVWQMEDAQIFKYPSTNTDNQSLSTITIEDYCKVVKNPMFLETVGYKLKNRVYHKIEHAVRDFRRIVYNSKLYHKNDHDRVKTIESLSKKLEELFEEHFASWDLDNISGSPREGSPIPNRFKSIGQKPVAGRHGGTKKSPSSSVVTEIPSTH